jgi:ferredoxin
MALQITEECVNCNACVDTCPNTATSLGADIFEIDPKPVRYQLAAGQPDYIKPYSTSR